MNKELKVKKLVPHAKLPTRANEGDLGYDIYASEDYVVLSNGLVSFIPTGICCGFPEGYGALIRDRSSMAAKGLFCVGGVIDNGYTGEIQVMLQQRYPTVRRYHIKAGDKIAQLVPIKVQDWNIVEQEELGNTERGHKGFGSSGE